MALRAAIQGRGLLEPAERDLRLSASGERFFAGLDIDVNELHKRQRHFTRACLDWSERQPLPAGALGAALIDQFVTRVWVSRRRNDRAVHVTAAGRRGLRRWCGLGGRGRQRGGAAMTADEACLASARLGAALVTASTVAWSTAGFFTRLIDVDAWTLLVWRGAFGGLFIAGTVLWQHRPDSSTSCARGAARPGSLVADTHGGDLGAALLLQANGLLEGIGVIPVHHEMPGGAISFAASSIERKVGNGFGSSTPAGVGHGGYAKTTPDQSAPRCREAEGDIGSR